jgi:hypothetical protein
MATMPPKITRASLYGVGNATHHSTMTRYHTSRPHGSYGEGIVKIVRLMDLTEFIELFPSQVVDVQLCTRFIEDANVVTVLKPRST